MLTIEDSVLVLSIGQFFCWQLHVLLSSLVSDLIESFLGVSVMVVIDLLDIVHVTVMVDYVMVEYFPQTTLSRNVFIN